MDSWHECEACPERLKISVCTPPSGTSLQISKMDIDVITILMFVMMEANDAVMYIYEHGHNMKDSETASYIYLYQLTQSIPNSHFWTNVIRAAIQGTNNICINFSNEK